MPDETDARSIITASPSENWIKPPGRPRTTWMKTIQQDLRSNNLSLDEAITGSELSTLEINVCVWHYAHLVVHATQEEEEEEDIVCVPIISPLLPVTYQLLTAS